jgi:hypothetical protein
MGADESRCTRGERGQSIHDGNKDLVGSGWHRGAELHGLGGARLFQADGYGQSSVAFENNVYAQIGLVMLIGLAAKNAIPIVELSRGDVPTRSAARLDQVLPHSD